MSRRWINMLRAEDGFGIRLGLIVAAGMALRALQTLLVAPWPPRIFGDEAYYNLLAQIVARGDGFVRPAQLLADGASVPTAERAPLFTLALAGLAKLGVTGGNSRLLGVATGGVTILMVGLLAHRLAGRRAGLIAATLAALYPTLIAADGALMTESLYGALFAVALYAAYRMADEEGFLWPIVFGAVTSLAAMARGEGLILVVLLLIPLLRSGAGRRRAAVALLAFAVVLAPWTIRNLSVFDRPVLVATEGGETLRGANCDPVYYGANLGGWEVSCIKPFGHGNEAVELDKEGHEGLKYARHHAGRVPVVLAARLGRTWGLYKPYMKPEGRVDWVSGIGVTLFYLLVPLGAYGLVVLRRRGVAIWNMLVPFIAVSIVALIGYGAVRFRHSAEIALVVLAGVALDQLWSKAPFNRRSARAGRA